MKWNSIETFFLDLDGTLQKNLITFFGMNTFHTYIANSKDIEFKKERRFRKNV